MSIKKPKIPKCTYCGQELTCYSLDENVWMCDFCGFLYRVYNGKPFPKLGWIKPEEQKTIPQHKELPSKKELKTEDEMSLYEILNNKLGYNFTMGDIRFFINYLENVIKWSPLEFRAHDAATQREIVKGFVYWKKQHFS
jgi:rubredoxin